MRIKIVDNSIYITEQNYIGGKQVGIVSSAVFPTIIYNGDSVQWIFLRGTDDDRKNSPLRLNSMKDLKVVLKAINNWCKVNNESFRVELK